MTDVPTEPTPAPLPISGAGPHKHGDGVEMLNPTEVPLLWGRGLKPFPAPHASAHFNPMKWLWFPGLVFDIRLFLSVIGTASMAGALVLAITGSKDMSFGKALGMVVLLFSVGFAAYLRINISVNQAIRTALCRCYAKREVAAAVWAKADEKDLIYAKDKFHEEKSMFYHVVVLRDGTVEIWSAGNDEVGGFGDEIGELDEKIGETA